jgi:hypothetical protein
MKNLFAIAALIGMASTAWGGTEYRRPTADVDAGSAETICTGSGGSYGTSSSMSAVYSGKSGAGPNGSSATLAEVSPSSGSGNSNWTVRKFTTWQSTGFSYTSLAVNISIKCTVTTGGSCQAFYSTNGGSSWTNFGSITTSQATYSATITGTSLANVQVAVCSVSVYTTSQGTTTSTVYDIWTNASYTQALHRPYSYMWR